MSRIIRRKTANGLPWQAEFSQGSGVRRLRLKKVFQSKHAAIQWLTETTAVIQDHCILMSEGYFPVSIRFGTIYIVKRALNQQHRQLVSILNNTYQL